MHGLVRERMLPHFDSSIERRVLHISENEISENEISENEPYCAVEPNTVVRNCAIDSTSYEDEYLEGFYYLRLCNADRECDEFSQTLQNETLSSPLVREAFL